MAMFHIIVGSVFVIWGLTTDPLKFKFVLFVGFALIGCGIFLWYLAQKLGKKPKSGA